MPDFQISQDTLLPALAATLSDANGVLNLANTTVNFQMRTPGSGSTMVVNSGAVIDDAAAGSVHYNWVAPDVAAPGLYIGWFRVTQTVGGKSYDVPNPGLVIEVTRGAG